MNLIWRILNALMGALFLFAVALQYNDDDPLRWMALYAVAALPCILVVVQRHSVVMSAVIAVISLVWAAVFAVQGAWSVHPSEMFAEWEMKSEQVRQTREMFGLLVVFTWMALVLIFSRLAKPKP